LIDSQRNDRMTLRRRSLYLPEDVGRSRGVLRQDQNNRIGRIDCMNDFARIVRARRCISGRDPALETLALQDGGDVIRDGGVVGGVADENVGLTITSVIHLFFAAAFSHVDPPPTFTSCWQMIPVFIKVCWPYVAVGLERRL
jgi:hypothetical protein